MLDANVRDGSLRHAAGKHGAKVLLYEGGETWRFDDWAIDAGVVGVQRVLAALGMAEPLAEPAAEPSEEYRASGWVRPRRTGILQLEAQLGQHVEQGDRLGGLSDSIGRRLRLVHADRAGVIVGRTEAPLVNRGDALVGIATRE